MEKEIYDACIGEQIVRDRQDFKTQQQVASLFSFGSGISLLFAWTFPEVPKALQQDPSADATNATKARQVGTGPDSSMFGERKEI